MKIETFEKLLHAKYGSESSVQRKYARVTGYPTNSLIIRFKANATKNYSYNGSNIEIARRLGLVPVIDVVEESHKAISSLLTDGITEIYTKCLDTIRVYLHELDLGYSFEDVPNTRYQNELEEYKGKIQLVEYNPIWSSSKEGNE